MKPRKLVPTNKIESAVFSLDRLSVYVDWYIAKGHTCTMYMLCENTSSNTYI